MTLRSPGKVMLSARNTPPLLVRKFPSDVSIQSMRFPMAASDPIGPVFGGLETHSESLEPQVLAPGRAQWRSSQAVISALCAAASCRQRGEKYGPAPVKLRKTSLVVDEYPFRKYLGG